MKFVSAQCVLITLAISAGVLDHPKVEMIAIALLLIPTLGVFLTLMRYDNQVAALEGLTDPKKVDAAIARGSLAPPR